MSDKNRFSSKLDKINNVRCPKCNAPHSDIHHRTIRLPRYKCRACGFEFDI